MSNLNRVLGDQGRALVNGSFQNYLQPTPQDLDFLINDLRFPLPDTTIHKLLGYLYHYIPYVKYEHNLKLVVASFLNNPLCFCHEGAPFESNYMIIEVFKLIADKKLRISKPTLSIKSWYTIILKEINNFALFNPQINSWKVLPIISGLLLSNDLRNMLYTKDYPLEYRWFFKDWDEKITKLFRYCLKYTLSAVHSDDVINLTLVSLAITYKKEEDIRDYTLNISSNFIISRLIHLIFGESDISAAVYTKFFFINPGDSQAEEIAKSEIMLRPVLKQLNKLSFLLESYFKRLPIHESSFPLILDSLDRIHTFNKALCFSTQASFFNQNPVQSTDGTANALNQQFWYLMKTLLFAEVVVYQGILTRFLTSTAGNNLTFFSKLYTSKSFNSLELEYKQISLKILHNLYYMNHISHSIGQGGFDSYNFVYYLTLEFALNNGPSTYEFENLTRFLIGDYQEVNLFPDVINNNYIVRCKVLFVLGLWENYLQQEKQNQAFIKQEIFSVCLHLVDDSIFVDPELIEASHSVLLICFSNEKNSTSLKESTEYVQLLIKQFPRLLSPNQLSIGVETVGKKILSNPISYSEGFHANSVDEFLNFLYFACLHARSGISIDSHESTNEVAFASAQPISEIAASSTMSHLDKKKNENTDIIRANKRKKPKAIVNLRLPKNNSSKDYKFERRTKPETTREALIVSTINLIPYLPLSIFTKWLNKIWSTIEMSNAREIPYLTSMLWKVLSENMDLNRCEIGFRWWYESKRAAENLELSLLKL
ncbi:uncharacterized protein AC631_05083 [Debaryomyces fabryi]|uniref:Uncharacterized protein n=1 Tax=Debaryomyces fabryi TaxID=58627 RepID=A0A0V1PSM0_9ASCO|nr:uncharacterized protein AC631_05083 [Debaryomyces fabryi]KRZ99156.1 hypothetical protein AC631_05083 [Debaryomyces fabryi]CUM45082.1 unnamed protein product [Debaryomyces fabryi]